METVKGKKLTKWKPFNPFEDGGSMKLPAKLFSFIIRTSSEKEIKYSNSFTLQLTTKQAKKTILSEMKPLKSQQSF
jgi:hypothetical protein